MQPKTSHVRMYGNTSHYKRGEFEIERVDGIHLGLPRQDTLMNYASGENSYDALSTSTRPERISTRYIANTKKYLNGEKKKRESSPKNTTCFHSLNHLTHNTSRHSIEIKSKQVADSTDRRNTICSNSRFLGEWYRWHKWGGLGYRRHKKQSCGSAGKAASH